MCLALTRVSEVGLYSAGVLAGRRANTNATVDIGDCTGWSVFAAVFDTAMPSLSLTIDVRTRRVLEIPDTAVFALVVFRRGSLFTALS